MSDISIQDVFPMCYTANMTFNLQNAVEIIKTNPHFVSLKKIVENNPYHDHEPVYDHLLKTHATAQKAITADFITNQKAKEEFNTFLQKPVGNITTQDALLLTALLHDIGKALEYKDSGNTSSILTKKPDGNTQCAGHEYWGCVFLPEFIQNINLDEIAKNYIATTILLHDTFNEDYFRARKEWSIEILMDDVKARAEGRYKEVLFNIYCDCYTATPFQFAIALIETLFNHPDLYTEREYFLP